MAPAALWHFSIDHFRDSGAWPKARFAGAVFDWQTEGMRHFAGFHAMLGAAARSCNDVSVQHLLHTPDWLHTLQREFSGIPVLFVGLHCPVETPAQREPTRSNRPLGRAERRAERDAAVIHTGSRYNLERCGTHAPDQSASVILAAHSGDRTGFMDS